MQVDAKVCVDVALDESAVASDWIKLLQWRSARQADQIAYTFLKDGESDAISLTYSELHSRAKAIAAALQARGAMGERVVLIFPPGLDYICALFGCFYAGAISVPAYPPRLNRNLLRLQTIIADSEASLALTTAPILRRLHPSISQLSELLQWLTIDEITDDQEADWLQPNISGNTLAILQYTSGSTGTPRGVLLSHGNLLSNSKLLARAFGYDSSSRCVSWLPMYHDMGLIGGILQPLHGGFHCTLMSPTAFLQKPFRWLQAISENRASISGAPNFAYELCVSRITAEQRALLDLSSWNTAFNGAEPIRVTTLRRFAAQFASCGFLPEAFFPCYGLAEDTLFVSGGHADHDLFVARVPSTGKQEVKTLVSCGCPFPEQRVIIVDPETRLLCDAGETGEIWVSGASVAQGYWKCQQETSWTFEARLADTGEGPFLRTGDLGFMRNGQLFVSGRLKDVIIIRGLNHYPQDIEATVEQSHIALRPGCCAAFSLPVDGEERLVVAQELASRQSVDLSEILDAIRHAVVEQHELSPYAILLLQPHTIPTTTSGKIQRRACREAITGGKLKIVGQWYAPVNSADAWPIAEREQQVSSTKEENVETITSWLIERLVHRSGVASQEIKPDHAISQHGLDSLSAIELLHDIEIRFGFCLAQASLLQSITISELAAEILDQLQGSTLAQVLTPDTSSAEGLRKHALSRGQQALWFLQQLAPESAAYNIASAVKINGLMDPTALQRAFQNLVDRHPSLRTSFAVTDGEIVQLISEKLEAPFKYHDASAWAPEFINAILTEEAHRPFDLSVGPLLRINLFSTSEQDHILILTMHHIITDFWSLGILIHELGVSYAAEKSGIAAEQPLPPATYTNYARQQARMLSGREGEILWAYWEKQLMGMPFELNLPTDRPRPAVQSYSGASHPFKLSAETTKKLKALARQHEVTLYMILLAIFQVFLHRWTGQEDFAVGSLVAGRRRAEWASVVGYFVNPLVMRANLSGRPSFATLLQRVRQSVLDALDHQDYPFPSLVERLQPVRGPSRSAIFQTMFSFQKPHQSYEARLASFALGEAGGKLRLGDLELESLPLEQRISQFDLTFIAAEIDDEISGALEYNTDLFDTATIVRMTTHIQTLVDSVLERPMQRVSDLQMLTHSEQNRLLVEWNHTTADFSASCIQDQFAEQVERTPTAAALVFGAEELNFRELNARANQLAHYLIALGVRAETRVGICVGRSVEMVVAMLAVLKAGGAYVPLDPSSPKQRVGRALADAQVAIVLTRGSSASSTSEYEGKVIALDSDWPEIAEQSDENPKVAVLADNLAYMIYTSGSTGTPKGVMVSHRAVSNCFSAMDQRIGCHAADTMLALTSISFDISILELLWTLTRGAKVVLLPETAFSNPVVQKQRITKKKALDFSLFYFADTEQGAGREQYQLLLNGAMFADRNGFAAVWTPERHFHAFGGLYPNPSVTSAAIAGMTDRIQIRAGSVVLPLHNPIRVAEEWSLVDNLSKGRVGVAFASGWHADDFVFFPEKYADRKRIMFEDIEVVRKLWRGEPIRVRGGAANEIELRILPRPVQPDLPIWITAAGSEDTFIKAGEIGANVLTHLLGQTVDEVAEKIQLYRNARANSGHDIKTGRVTLMLHTFIGLDKEAVREKVRIPFTNYLKSSLGLIANLAKSLDLDFDLSNMSAEDSNDLLAFAFARYFDTSALFGTPASCQSMIETVKSIGCDEVACLIDFGVDTASALAGLEHLKQLMELSNQTRAQEAFSLRKQAVDHGATLLQCTPSMLQLLILDGALMKSLSSLATLLVGGEALPAALVRQVKKLLPGKLVNMYGPTETTIWSTTAEIADPNVITIGGAILNTQIFILDRNLQPVPVSVPGEIYIAGEGLARGYHQRPDLTAEKFIPNPFGAPGSRLYKTGDTGRYLVDGNIEHLGRLDSQIKIRGFRVELGEIEAVLAEYESVREAVALVREDNPGDQRLVAYVVLDPNKELQTGALREFLKRRLPDYMVPASFIVLKVMPLTANSKIDRKALPRMEPVPPSSSTDYIAPRNRLERTIAGLWQQALKTDKVGIQDNFFDIGGHSLLMAQVHSRLNETFAANWPLIKMLEHPTISSLAQFISAEQKKKTNFDSSLERASKQLAAHRRHREAMKARAK